MEEFRDAFYHEIRFYEQWWLIIDLLLLLFVTTGAALASYRRQSYWYIMTFGFAVTIMSGLLIIFGVVLAWNLPRETVEVFSQEFLATVRRPPPAQRTPNMMNYLAILLATLLPYMGWKLAKFAWFMRRGSSTYNPTSAIAG